MSKQSSGRVWPIAISAAITMVFGFCVATVVVTNKADLQLSDRYMTSYQDADVKANDYFSAAIEFDKEYKLEYPVQAIKEKGSILRFKVSDLKNKPVNNANLILSISRPETKIYNKTLKTTTSKDGVYSFSGLEFPKAGIWNLEVKVVIGDKYKFYNIKVDTRNTKSHEF